VLCDLQGGSRTNKQLAGIVITDPVILSKNREYGLTDLGPEGISTFFARHKCNKYCRAHWRLPGNVQQHLRGVPGTTMLQPKQNDIMHIDAAPPPGRHPLGQVESGSGINVGLIVGAVVGAALLHCGLKAATRSYGQRGS
jgi:hypothetical protein